MLVPQSAEVC